jgi:hypothetical protein
MPRIANITVNNFQDRINRFKQRYVNDWNGWITVQPDRRTAQQFGIILRKWQACRPNRMRRAQADTRYDGPYLDTLINNSAQCLLALQDFDIRLQASFTPQACDSLVQLWDVFQNLSYYGRAREGRAGVVGISKAVLLLTEGRVGPAFDSTVRKHLGLRSIENANEWINALRVVSRDIQQFEFANQITLQQAVPQQYAGLSSGRIYDMALGPGG